MSSDVAGYQRRAWDNKVAKGFNTTDVPLEFMLLHGEVAEAFTAWRCNQPDFGEELADVAIFLLGLSALTSVDLASEIEWKLSENERRVYSRDGNGVPVRLEAPE